MRKPRSKYVAGICIDSFTEDEAAAIRSLRKTVYGAVRRYRMREEGHNHDVPIDAMIRDTDVHGITDTVTKRVWLRFMMMQEHET